MYCIIMATLQQLSLLGTSIYTLDYPPYVHYISFSFACFALKILEEAIKYDVLSNLVNWYDA